MLKASSSADKSFRIRAGIQFLVLDFWYLDILQRNISVTFTQ